MSHLQRSLRRLAHPWTSPVSAQHPSAICVIAQTMKSPQLGTPQGSNRTNEQGHSCALAQATRPIHATPLAKPNLTDGCSRSLSGPFQDPFAYFKAYRSTEPLYAGNMQNQTLCGDGGTRDDPFGAQPRQAVGEQPACRPRTIPYNLAVRFANRSNGAPLATIVEQGSISTLNSHGSLLSMGRLPSIRVVENMSPILPSHRVSHSLDERALKDSREKSLFKKSLLSEKNPSSKTRCENADRIYVAATSGNPTPHEIHDAQIPQLPNLDLAVDSRGLKGFFLDVLANVKGVSRSKSRSSSVTDQSAISVLEDGPHSKQQQFPTRCGGHTTGQISSSIKDTTDKKRILHPTSSSLPLNGKARTAYCSAVGEETEAPNTVHAPTTRLTALPISKVSQSQEKPPISASAHLPRPTSSQNPPPSVRPSNATSEQTHQGTLAFPVHSTEEVSSLHTVDDLQDEGPPLREPVQDRSRNASFCSTVSTSYSGTVLGVDLDLQHEFPHNAHRSVTPVWFTPVERSSSIAQDHPESESESEERESAAQSKRLITSSALTSLLPTAAAEGIVKPIWTTPKLSFYSPSGTMIQLLDSSPSSVESYREAELHATGTSPMSALYYKSAELPSAKTALSSALSQPPARPALVPLTTPVHSTAPLPDHLRAHHNHQHAEKAQVSYSMDEDAENRPQVLIGSGASVPGCGGVVRPSNLGPHSGVPSHSKHPRSGSYMSCLRDSETGQPRFSFLSSWPSPVKGNTLKKRSPRPPETPGHGNVSWQPGFSPVVGQALRICFCQPYDGGGNRMDHVGYKNLNYQCCGAMHAGDPRDTTPNARLPELGYGGTKVATISKGRARSDSAVSIGVGDKGTAG